MEIEESEIEERNRDTNLDRKKDLLNTMDTSIKNETKVSKRQDRGKEKRDRYGDR